VTKHLKRYTTAFAKMQCLANGPLGSKHIAIKITKNTVLLTVFTE
jgi:hypothetical protein